MSCTSSWGFINGSSPPLDAVAESLLAFNSYSLVNVLLNPAGLSIPLLDLADSSCFRLLAEAAGIGFDMLRFSVLKRAVGSATVGEGEEPSLVDNKADLEVCLEPAVGLVGGSKGVESSCVRRMSSSLAAFW